jgi:putative radical SAM enzyme (TIGR03279 family)
MMPCGLTIQAIDPDSGLAALGLKAGDRIVAIDDLVPRDVIDLQLELASAREVTIQRVGETPVRLDAPKDGFDPGAIELAEAVPGGIRECNNHCEFCFIRGLPPGLRSSLYVFDDDYRYSFVWGNFLTLTNLDEADWARIGYQRLSPLNVSVHATDPAVRRRLLNNRHAPDILPQLERLSRLGVKVNAQIVLCTGVNDGLVLDRSIQELAALHPTVASLSVVPVGLTRYSRVSPHIRRPTQSEAYAALQQCEDWHSKLRAQLGVGFVYASDELYVLAGRTDVPDAGWYDGFPVLTNGVGLLRNMLDDWHRLIDRLPTVARQPRKVAWVTGGLAAPALERMADHWLTYAGWRPEVAVIDNSLFGQGVTVSGLLSGADLIRVLRSLPTDIEDVVLPRGPFGFDGRCTLDGVSAEEVGAAHPGRVHLASTPHELLAIL